MEWVEKYPNGPGSNEPLRVPYASSVLPVGGDEP